MSGKFSRVRLGEVLEPVSRATIPDVSTSYRLLGVRLDGKGPFHRETVTGAETSASELFRVKEGDFIYSRLFAWRGAFGLIGSDLADSYVSSEFPTFRVDDQRLDRRFLRLWFHLPSTLRRVEEDCSGSTPLTRNRFKEQFFLNLEIELPPVDQQRRIVDRIEAMAQKIDDAMRLAGEVEKETQELMAAKERKIWPNEALINATPLADVTEFLARGRQSEQGDSEHYLIKTQHVQMGRYVSTKMRLAPHVAAKVNPEAVARDSDILIACSAAGCLGRVARYTSSGHIVSTDTHVAIARAKTEIIRSEYLFAYLRSAPGQYQLRSRERGNWQREKIGFRLTELNMNDLRRVPVPVPSLAMQQRIVYELNEFRSKVDSVCNKQMGASKEMAALLPAQLALAFRREV